MIRFLTFKEIEREIFLIEKKTFEYIEKQIFKFENRYNNEHFFFARSKLERDLIKSKIYYKNGCFYGTINNHTLSEIKKLGGIYNSNTRGYQVNFYSLPERIQKIISKCEQSFMNFNDYVLKIKNNIRNIKADKLLYFLTIGSADIIKKMNKATGEEIQKKDFNQEITSRANKKIPQLKQDLIDYVNRQLEHNTKRKVNFNTIKDTLKDGFRYRCNTFIEYSCRDVLISIQKQTATATDSNRGKWLDINYLKGNPHARVTHGEFTERSIKGEWFELSNPPIDRITHHSVLPGEEPNCSCLFILDEKQFYHLVKKYKK